MKKAWHQVHSRTRRINKTHAVVLGLTTPNWLRRRLSRCRAKQTDIVVCPAFQHGNTLMYGNEKHQPTASINHAPQPKPAAASSAALPCGYSCRLACRWRSPRPSSTLPRCAVHRAISGSRSTTPSWLDLPSCGSNCRHRRPHKVNREKSRLNVDKVLTISG